MLTQESLHQCTQESVLACASQFRWTHGKHIEPYGEAGVLYRGVNTSTFSPLYAVPRVGSVVWDYWYWMVPVVGRWEIPGVKYSHDYDMERLALAVAVASEPPHYAKTVDLGSGRVKYDRRFWMDGTYSPDYALLHFLGNVAEVMF